MAYVAVNYSTNPSAPVNKWTCAPTSRIEPSAQAPSGMATKGCDLCGQCVSYVKRVCPSLPPTTHWTKGAQVKNNARLAEGTVIATCNAAGRYEGHAAIYASQTPVGINVYDQYVTPPSPKAVGPRTLRWGAHGNSNDGDKYYVVD